MKKSTRLLALLLCVVMVAALLPAFALADGSFYGGATTPGGASGVNWHDKDSLNAPYLQLSKTRVTNGKSGANFQVTIEVNRYDLRYESKTGGVDLNDWGYGDRNIFLIPVGAGTTPGTTTFMLRRNQDAAANLGTEDINRWWRWAKDTDPAGYHTNNDNYDSTNPGIDGVTAVVICEAGRYNGVRVDTEQTTIPKTGNREQHNYLLFDKRWTFEWTGGNRQRSEKAKVTIDRSKLELGDSTVLWSANGTDVNHQNSYLFLDIAFIGNNGILSGRRVWNGDTSKHTIAAAEAREVVYEYGYEGCPAPDGYIVWTTGKASTSQKHKIIGAPSREGYIFEGWLCTEGESAIEGKYFLPGQDLNNGITQNVVLQAQWKKEVTEPQYYVSFNGNDNTNTDITMKNQGFYFNTPDTLSRNLFEQVYTVNFNATGGVSPVVSARAESTFMGWEDRGDLNGYSYTDFDAPYYANTYSDLYAAFGYDKVDLLNHYINNGIGEGRNATGSPRGTYPNQATVSDLTNVDTVVPLYAQWQLGSVTLPTPERLPTPDEEDDNIVAFRFDGWYTAETGGALIGYGGASYTPGANVTLYAHWTPVTGSKFYVAHVQNGTVVNTETLDTEDFETIDFTSRVSSGYLYGGTFNSQNCLEIATEHPTSFTPIAGNTYYIWEVSEEHLRPVNLTTWVNTNDGTGNFDVDKIFLITAIDRLQYQEAGFEITKDGQTKPTEYKSDEGKIAYDKIGVQVGMAGTEVPLSYSMMNPNAKTTTTSKIVCCPITGCTPNVGYTMKPYWITFDGVKVYGTETRTFTYRGPGNTEAHKQLIISDYSGLSAVKTVAPPNEAPMRLMSMFRMSTSVPVVVETPDVITVVDGDNSYTVETCDNSIAVEPAGADGQLFAGWYTDETCTKVADLNAVEDGDTVYAKYISDSYLQVKYSFGLLTKTLSLTSAVDSKDYAETGYVISTKNGDKTVVVSKYATTFALQNANKLFGVEKNAPLINADYKLSGLSKNDTVTVTPYWVTADGTTVYGTARTLTYTGLTMKG